MDIFTLSEYGEVSWGGGEVINGLDSKLWVERYDSPGDFKLTGLPTDELRETLAIGTLISHSKTLEIMVVEDHHIKETVDKPPELTITGRSFTSFFEQRIATNHTMGFPPPKPNEALLYVFQDVTLSELAVQLIERRFNDVIYEGFEVPNLVVSNEIGDGEVGGDSEETKNREIKRGTTIAEAVSSTLAEFDGGVRVERPHDSDPNITIIVHDGLDLTGDIQFSYEAGDLEDVEYFWSNRKHKTSAYVVSKYGGVWVDRIPPWPFFSGPESGLEKRVTWIDASDINFDPKTTAQENRLYNMLRTRVKRDAHLFKETTIVEATASKTARHTFRQDYSIGDTVMVVGNYGMSARMRITEHAEAEDENGSSSFPTLTNVNEGETF